MGCHTWFFKNAELALNEDCTDQEFEDNCVDEFHDLFRYDRRNSDGTYSDIKLRSKDETLQFLIDEDNYIRYNERRPKHKVLNTIYAFWEHYPDGLIEFG